MKTTLLTVLLCSLLFWLSTCLKGQNGTIDIFLPDLYNTGIDETIQVPDGRPIYALLVSGYGRNGNFDELHFYKFAKVLMEHGAYVHYAWWNNLCAPYMERPLHDDQSYPGDLSQDFLNFTNPYDPKAQPPEDFQFVSDARTFLSAIQQHNPDAIIIVVGHSMGGGAIIHLANAWTTVENGRIDILAPIDPVGNRNWPWAGGPTRASMSDFNWTRWRVTRDFFGYKAIENFGGIFPWNKDCQITGDWIDNYNDAAILTDPLCAGGPLNIPYIHPPVNTYTFNENVVNLYHRWQTEALFPFDFEDEYLFGHNAPPGGSTFQQKVVTKESGYDEGGWPLGNSANRACCPDPNGKGWPNDGHGEIVGYRGPIPNPVPLGVRVGTSPNCGDDCLNKIWPWRFKDGNNWNSGDTSSRINKLKDLENLSAGSAWEHHPYNPDLCLVSNGLIFLFNKVISQWIQQPSGTSIINFRSVYFTDANNGWVVGDGGTIKHTTNNGNTWINQTSGTSYNITDVYFTDASTGWIVGSYGLIKHTTDGGNNWILQSSGTSKTIYGVYFTDANNGWIVGDDGLIKHTTDGGNAWPLQSTPTLERLTDIHFTDANTGWAVGYGGVVLLTSDGGDSWNTPGNGSGTTKNISAIDFINTNDGWFVGADGLIKHTTDGGDSWDLQTSGTSRIFTDVSFIDANTGWGVGYTGLIKHTTDGGTTWDLQITGRSNNLQSVCFTDANTGWAVGSEGLILHKAIAHQLNLTLFLEGPYNDIGMNTNLNTGGLIPLYQPYTAPPWNYPGTEGVDAVPAGAVDWVLIELRDAVDATSATPATTIGRMAVFLLSDGTVVARDGTSMPEINESVTQNLFVVIYQRNHLPIMSANPLVLQNGIYEYDFTTDAVQVYGGVNAHKEIGTNVWGMIGGNGNSDYAMDSSDYIQWKSEAGEAGYKSGDYNMDTEVDNKDKNDVWVPNEGKASQVPQ